MADWYGTSRSNYVKLINIEKLKEAFPTARVEETEGFHCIISDDQYGGDPSNYDEEKDVDTFLLDEIHHYLEKIPDNVFVWISAGAEKARYITGDAIAIDHTGTIVNRVSLEEIYEDNDWSRAEY